MISSSLSMRPLEASNGIMVPFAAAMSFCSCTEYQHLHLVRARVVPTWSRRSSDKPLGIMVKLTSPKRPFGSSNIVVSSMAGENLRKAEGGGRKARWYCCTCHRRRVALSRTRRQRAARDLPLHPRALPLYHRNTIPSRNLSLHKSLDW